MKRLVATMLAGIGLAATVYVKNVRPWYSAWGATEEELMRPMPLDDRIPNPRMVTTRAITIGAPPEAIWPWLVQMGDPPRAGYYSYTWIERLAGLRITNQDQLLPEFQTVEVGQALDRNGTMVVQAVDPGRSLVLGPPASVEELRATWAFALYPFDAHSTRLVTRVRSDWDYSQMLRSTPVFAWPVYLLIEPGAFIMEYRMFHEIKRHAEGLAMRDVFPSVVIRPFTRLARLA
jgi:hypothetical protein